MSRLLALLLFNDCACSGVLTLMTLLTFRVVVFWAPGTRSALDSADIDAGRDVGTSGVFVPSAAGRSLTFSRLPGAARPIVDNETGSTWSVTGRATAGPLYGETVQPVVHGDHFWFAWAAFEPQTTIWSGS